MGNRALEVISGIEALLTIGMRVQQAIAESSAVLKRAQAEGRDVTQEELAQAQFSRQTAIDDFNRLIGK